MQVPKPAPCTCDAEVQVAHSHHSTWKTTRVQNDIAPCFPSCKYRKEMQNNEHIALPQGWGPQLKFNAKPCHRKGRYKQQVSNVKFFSGVQRMPSVISYICCFRRTWCENMWHVHTRSGFHSKGVTTSAYTQRNGAAKLQMKYNHRANCRVHCRNICSGLGLSWSRHIEALILFKLKIIEDLVPSCGISIRLKCSSHSDTFAQSPFLDLSLPRGWISFHTPLYAACAEKLHAEKRVQKKARTLRTRFECGGALSHLDHNMESRTGQNNTRYTDDIQVF